MRSPRRADIPLPRRSDRPRIDERLREDRVLHYRPTSAGLKWISTVWSGRIEARLLCFSDPRALELNWKFEPAHLAIVVNRDA